MPPIWTAITRAVSPTLNQCELTHLARRPIDIDRAILEHHGYQQCLRELAPSTERAGVTDAARRPIGQVRTRLEYTDVATLLAELPTHLRALQYATAAASAAVTQRYFEHAAPVSWAHEGT